MGQDLDLLEIENHCIRAAKQVPSPNHNARPAGEMINLIVVHCISLPPGEFAPETVESFFCNELPADAHPYFAEIAEMEVSSHLYIGRAGQIIQFVPFDRRAWHAGQSCFNGRGGCNDFSIGIELAGADEVAYTEEQYATLIQVIQSLHHAYPETESNPVMGHSDIAPGRKTDPGPAFDWAKLEAFGIQGPGG